MSKKTHALTAIGALLAAVALAAGSAAAQQVTLRLHTLIPPPANPYKTFLKPWTERIAKASKGKLKIQIYPSMQLGGKPPQLVDQVRDGVVDIVWTLPGYTAGRFSRLEVFELPFVHVDPLSSTLALQEFQAKHLKEEFKDYKVKEVLKVRPDHRDPARCPVSHGERLDHFVLRDRVCLDATERTRHCHPEGAGLLHRLQCLWGDVAGLLARLVFFAQDGHDGASGVE